MKIAANLTMLYTEYNIFERFAKAAEDGFTAVEFFFPYEYDASLYQHALDKNSLDLVLFNMHLGNWDAGDRGFAGQPARKSEYQEAIRQAVNYGKLLKPPRINCPSGPSENSDESWKTLKENFESAANALKEENIKMVVEPINHNDVPNALLHNVSQAVSFIDTLETDNIHIQYDLYHSIRTGEDPFETLKSFIDRIDHIQVADVPGRHQPGTGDVDFEKLFNLLEKLNYQGYVSMEFHPEGHTSDSFSLLHEMGLLRK